MKALLTIEVPDEHIVTRLAEIRADQLADAEADPSYDPGPAATPEEYVRECVEGVANDELRIALWGWPITTTVEVESG